MGNDNRRDGERDHPQTINLESDARGSAAGADERQGGEQRGEDEPEQASEAGDAQAALSHEEAEAVRRHAQGFRTMGDAVGGGAGLDVGSGTSGDKGDLGGGGSGGGRG